MSRRSIVQLRAPSQKVAQHWIRELLRRGELHGLRVGKVGRIGRGEYKAIVEVTAADAEMDIVQAQVIGTYLRRLARLHAPTEIVIVGVTACKRRAGSPDDR